MRWLAAFCALFLIGMAAIILSGCLPANNDNWESRFDTATALPLNNDVH